MARLPGAGQRLPDARPRPSGFAVHHDTHDVFVLQVAGRKRWRVYEPVLELPLAGQRWSPQLGDPGRGDSMTSRSRPATPSICRAAGRTRPTTSQDESLHLTIGLHPPTRLDALRAALQSMRRGRRRVPPHADGRWGAARRSLLDRLAARLTPGRAVAAACAAASWPRAGRSCTTSSPRCGPSTGSRCVDSVGAPRDRDLRTGARPGDGALLLFEGKELSFPPQASAAVAAAVKTRGPVHRGGPARLPRRGRAAGAGAPARARGLPAGQVGRHVCRPRTLGLPCLPCALRRPAIGRTRSTGR